MEKRVRNRDLPLLTCVRYTMQDIRMLEEKRDWTRERLERVTSGLSGMPRGGGGPHGMEEGFEKLADLDRRHAKKLRQCEKELDTAERLINSVESRPLRTFISMVYLRGMTREDVSAELNLTEWEYRKMKERVEGAERLRDVKWDG